MIDIESLTVKELREIVRLAGCVGSGAARKGKSHSLTVGECVFIRTVTAYFTGRIVAVTSADIVLADAAWIADTGRFSAALKTGTLGEVEPYPDGVTVSRGGVIDVSPWKHALPRDVK